MKQNDKAELERLRALKKRTEDYKNSYNKENYRKFVCLYPRANSDKVDEAIKQSGESSISAYLTSLINKDLHKRGLM